MRWHLIRHGQSVANAEGWIAGHIDTPLSPLGRRQAEALRDVVADLGDVDVVCSDLQRAHDTARIAFPDHTLRVFEGLRERNIGDWAHRKMADIRACGDVKALLGWTSGPPNGESSSQVGLRVIRTLEALGPPDRDTVVVCHGGVIRAVVGVLDDTPRHRIGYRKVVNCELVTRELDSWSPILAALEVELA